MSPISLVAGDSEDNLCFDGRSCVSDVQDVSLRSSFQRVFAEFCVTLRKLEIDERGTIQ